MVEEETKEHVKPMVDSMMQDFAQVQLAQPKLLTPVEMVQQQTLF